VLINKQTKVNAVQCLRASSAAGVYIHTYTQSHISSVTTSVLVIIQR